MPSALEVIKLFNICLAGVAISAMLHGLLSIMPRGGAIVWSIAALTLIVTVMFLDDDLRIYGWLTTIAVFAGIALWMI